MIGNANMLSRTRVLPPLIRYVTVDGGAGAHLLAALSVYNGRFQQVTSPRHATMLLLIEPLTESLVPAIKEVARALPHPAFILRVNMIEPACEKTDDLFPGIPCITTSSVERLLEAMHDVRQWFDVAALQADEQEETTIELPQKQEQELATEMAVLSLGPLQPFTSGPLRVFLICDGEQIHSAHVQAGYAHRGIDQAMTEVTWERGVLLARQLDPLAPLAGQLAYIQALEMLQQWPVPITTQRLRDAALAIERASNALWWAARFASLLSATRLQKRAAQLASALTTQTALLWRQPPEEWMMPQNATEQARERSKNASSAQMLKKIAADIASLSAFTEKDRWLSLRTRGIGVITTQRLLEKGVQGPVLSASQQGAGDVRSRLWSRLQGASRDLATAAEGMQDAQPGQYNVDWNIPAGTVRSIVEGPRGPIGLRLTSDGKETPQHVEWSRPSVPLLALLPEWLVGQKLADAELLIASLDLAMMEADG